MLTIRPVRATDFEIVCALYVAASGVDPAPPLETIANLCHTEPDGCFIGELDGAVIGYAISHRSGSVGCIGSVAVADEHRGRGFGKALTAAARDHLAALEAASGPLWVPFHTAFGRIHDVLTARGYRVVCHHSNLVAADRAAWPTASDALFLRPWWT